MHIRLSDRVFEAFEVVTRMLQNIRVFWYVMPFVLVIRFLYRKIFRITVLALLHPDHADYSNNHKSARPSCAEYCMLMHVTVSVSVRPLLFSKFMKAGDLIRCLSVHHMSIQPYFQVVS